MIFSIVLTLFLVMGSVSASDLNNTYDYANSLNDNGIVLSPQNPEVSSDSLSDIGSPDDGKNYSIDEENNESANIQDNMKQSVLAGNDVELYYKNGTSFKVVLSDSEGSLLANQSIIFTINNINYTRVTGDDGVASIAINLKSGSYPISSYYEGNENYSPSFTTNTIEVLPTISGEDIEKYYKNNTQYYATFVDGQGNFLDNAMVTFNINGVFYERKTNERGTARLNINLPPGKYILTAINPVNGEMHSNDIEVLPTISANDLTMAYRDGHKFTAHVLDDNGNPLAYSDVKFNVNGVFYTRVTDNDGNAQLNINLNVGQYIITATDYKGLSVSKKITIDKCDSTIKASDAHMIINVNRDYSVTLYGTNNKTIPFAAVNFKYNGATATAVTNENGKAIIPVLFHSEGEYYIEYEFKGNGNYNPYKSSSTIIVDKSTSILTGKDLKMYYRDGSKFSVTLTDSHLVPMENKIITFNLYGKLYDRTTDENGVASLNINLNPGTYEISYSYSNVDAPDYNKGSNTITVSKVPLSMNTKDLVFVYGESRAFTATLTDGKKRPLEGVDVTFNIYGKSYIRTTDASGVAKLNINLPVGYYDITTSVDGSFYTPNTKSNHVLVDGSIFTAYDITVYPGSFRDFSVTLLDAYENPITNADIQFTYNGITKHARTDGEGTATVSVGGLSNGDYPITYKYAERNNVGQSYIFASEQVLNTKNKISNLGPYSSNSAHCQASNPEIVSLARELTSGLTNPWDKARAIFNYVRDEISYSYYYDTYYGAVGTLHAHKGNCVDQSHLAVALYRAAGLPARYVHGTCEFNDGDVYGHVWTQVLIGDTWIVGDAINSRNSLGNVVNWNNYNYEFHAYYYELPF